MVQNIKIQMNYLIIVVFMRSGCFWGAYQATYQKIKNHFETVACENSLLETPQKHPERTKTQRR